MSKYDCIFSNGPPLCITNVDAETPDGAAERFVDMVADTGYPVARFTTVLVSCVATGDVFRCQVIQDEAMPFDKETAN